MARLALLFHGKNHEGSLGQTMCELLRDIASHADDRNCFSENDARMEGTDRHW